MSKKKEKQNSKLEIDNQIQNGPTRKRSITDCIFCILMLLFWIFGMFIFYYAYTEGDPLRLTQTYDYKNTPCGSKEHKTEDYPFIYFFQPVNNFGNGICVSKCPNWGLDEIAVKKVDCFFKDEETKSELGGCESDVVLDFVKASDDALFYLSEKMLVYNTTEIFGKFCSMSVAADVVEKISSDWFKKMSLLNQNNDKIAEYFNDIELSWKYFIIIGIVAFVISILSLFVIRYCAGVFVWITILLFLICLFVLGFFAQRESDRLMTISESEHYQGSDSTTYYNASNLHTVSIASYILGGLSFLIVLFSMSTIALSIAIIKSAALFVAKNFLIVFLPIIFAIINITYVIIWALGLAYLWSIGEPKPRLTGPFAEIIWSNKTIYLLIGHAFSLLWNIAFINYLLIFIIASSCSIWYFNNKDSPNYFSRPIATSIYWAFRYHLGSIALGAFILAIIWSIKVMLAYVVKHVQDAKKKGVSSKMVDYILKCLMVLVSCFERAIKFLSKLGFIQIAISGQNFCTSCFKAFMVLFKNPMKFGFVHALGTVFTFIGKIFVASVSGVIGYFALDLDAALSDKLSSKIFPTVFFIVIGFVIATVFFSIYGVAADTVLLCFFWDKEIANRGGRPVNAPAPMKGFYEKYRKQDKENK